MCTVFTEPSLRSNHSVKKKKNLSFFITPVFYLWSSPDGFTASGPVPPLNFSLCMSHFWVHSPKKCGLIGFSAYVDLHPAVPRESAELWDAGSEIDGWLSQDRWPQRRVLMYRLFHCSFCHFLQQTAAQQEMDLFSAWEASAETQSTSTSISNHGIVSAPGRVRLSKKRLF